MAFFKFTVRNGQDLRLQIPKHLSVELSQLVYIFSVVTSDID